MNKLGFSGSIAARFQSSQITPLLALVGLLLGVFAVLVTPREEEPQINVTFANVFIPFPGASAREVESLVASPAEQVLDEIEGIEHVYSTSMPGMAVLTVQYLVGEDRTDAIVRLFSKINSNQDWLPEGVGVGQPIVKPKYLTLPRNIKFAFEQQARVTFSSFKLDLDGEGWSSLMSSVSVRNRLTHPKSLIELHVSDQEVEGAEKALHWFAISYVSALADSYRALNRKLEEAQEILSKTETALDKGLKKSV